MMNDLIFQLHSPEEFRYLSSLGHWIAGYVFLGVSIIAFLQALGLFKSKQYLWPLLVVVAGIIFIPYSFLHHGFEKLDLVFKVIQLDPQQRQHIIMFNLLFVAGLVELLLSLKKIQGKLWQFVWPGTLFIIGYLFLTHPQHGTAEARAYSLLFHTILGSVILLAGVFRMATVIWSRKYKWVTYGWILFLFITSIMLITYNEPKGAYQMDSSLQQQNNQHMNPTHGN